MNVTDIFHQLDMDPALISDGNLSVTNPGDGRVNGRVQTDTKESVDAAIAAAVDAFGQWREVPAPRRGELVRLLGNRLREHKPALGALVTLETGKIYQEGLGEVQEMIDICDFATGLSRQLYGLVIASERPQHRMTEMWHPIGPVGIISAFNFPVAVWCWNAALALVCGNSLVWKPSEKTPLCALACQHLLRSAAAELEGVPEGLSQLVIGGAAVGEQLVGDRRVPVISATGSTAMGRKVAPVVAARFGRAILELGGNNAIIVAPSADLELAAQGILFGAVGTAGQRCTTTRRLFVHDRVYDELLAMLKRAWRLVRVGDPMADGTLVGPLIDAAAYHAMQRALAQASAEGAKVTGGERVLEENYPDGYFAMPALVEMPARERTVQEEVFAPILYVYRYHELDDAIRLHNDVPQGLSSALFTTDLREAERFTSASGSDCGIVNINIGTSGAEIGGALGGEKATGGGRESGSDAWKGYMRRVTSTLNYSQQLPLAQGIEFTIHGG